MASSQIQMPILRRNFGEVVLPSADDLEPFLDNLYCFINKAGVRFVYINNDNMICEAYFHKHEKKCDNLISKLINHHKGLQRIIFI